jgi:DNA modification methylase
VTTSKIAAQDEKFEGTVVVNDEYASLVPSLSKEEFESLKQLIKEDNGLTYAIIVNQHGVILDGYHRYKACRELEKKPKYQVKFFENPLLEQKFRIEININRRHLNHFQRIELQYKLETIENEIGKAKNRMSDGGKVGADKRWKKNTDNENLSQNADDRVVQNYTTPSNQVEQIDKTLTSKSTEESENSDKTKHSTGRVIDLSAQRAGVSPMTYFKGRQIIDNASEEIKEKLRKGSVKIDKVYRQLQKQQKRQELVNTAVSIFPTNNFELVLGDFNEKSKEFISDNSIDLMFTDPIYGSQYLPSYDDLARLAARVLKDGTSLITYVGNYAIPQVIRMMESAGLKYWWTIAVNLEGSFGRHHPRKVSIKWKPLLWFVKGDSTNTLDYMSDAIDSNRPEKIMHEYEQPTIDAEHVISRLTVENQIVLDPMMGSGTTGAAALKLKRKFIGLEIDADKFEIARSRLSKINEQSKTNVVN